MSGKGKNTEVAVSATAPTEEATEAVSETLQARLGLNLSITRVKNYLALNTLNRVFCEEADRLKESLKTAPEAGKPALEAKLKAVKSAKMRMSGATAVRLTVVLETLLNEWCHAALANTVANKKKQVEVETLLAVLPSLSLAPLATPLDVVRNATQFNSSDSSSADADVEVAEVETKETAVKGDAKAVSDEDAEAKADLNRFKTYIKKVMEEVKKRVEEHKAVRVAGKVYAFFNDALSELIVRYSNKLQLFATSMGIKTIAPTYIDTVTEMILHDGESPVETLGYETVKRKGKAADGTVTEEAVLEVVHTLTYASKRFENLHHVLEEKMALWNEETPESTEGAESKPAVKVATPKPATKAAAPKAAAPKAAGAKPAAKATADKPAAKAAAPKTVAPKVAADKPVAAPKTAAAPKAVAAPKSVASATAPADAKATTKGPVKVATKPAAVKVPTSVAAEVAKSAV